MLPNRIRWLLTALTTIMLCAGSAALAQALHDIHEGAGVPCAACHQQTPPEPNPPDSTCVACHGTMLDAAAGLSVDPHASPHLGPDEIPACTECHAVHRPSEVTCVVCHRGFQFEIK